VRCSHSLSSSLAQLKSANYLCTTEWVTSYEHIMLSFSTPQPHAVPSADSKATQAASNKEMLGMPHDIV
jgi:hypothetical protein